MSPRVLVVRGHARPRQFSCPTDLGASHVIFGVVSCDPVGPPVLSELNFWVPSAANFRALQPDELFRPRRWPSSNGS